MRLSLNRITGEKPCEASTRRSPGDLVAVCGVLLLTALELVALATAPVAQRPFVTGAVIGAGTAALITVWAVLHARHRAAQRPHHDLPAGPVDASWYADGSLDGFPMDEIRLFLLGPQPPLHRLDPRTRRPRRQVARQAPRPTRESRIPPCRSRPKADLLAGKSPTTHHSTTLTRPEQQRGRFRTGPSPWSQVRRRR
jgi:hypothetical protein